MLQLYTNIRNLRIAQNMSQEELAKKVGYASGKSMIAKIEKGLVNLPQSKIKLFASALGTSASELMGWDTNYTEDNADFVADMLTDERFTDYAKKVYSMPTEVREKVYSFIDFSLSETHRETK